MNLKIMLLITSFTIFQKVICKNDNPKVVVLITIDQFPNYYLEKFKDDFGKNGFNFLIENGTYFSNANFEHIFNETAPGHTAISTGTYGNKNGIITNEWFDKQSKKIIYCVEDDSHKVFNTSHKRSPKNLETYTIGDMLKLNSNFKSKVISISGKDRSAILTAGKFGDAAYWISDSIITTSNYYLNSLPNWVTEFNNNKKINSYIDSVWTKLLDDKKYLEYGSDNISYENIQNQTDNIFPHKIKIYEEQKFSKNNYRNFLGSPFSSEIIFEFSKKILENENFGKDNFTDLLFINLSANDYIGHKYGPNSYEVMDITIRTDKMIEMFLNYLEKKFGLENIILILTSDHGVAGAPEYIQEKVPNSNVRRVSENEIQNYCESILKNYFQVNNENFIDTAISNNIYLSTSTIQKYNLEISNVENILKESLKNYFPIADVLTENEMQNYNSSQFYEHIKRSYFKGRSGNLIYILKPYFIETTQITATHGMPYKYDSNVPIIFFGKQIQKKKSDERCSPIDIAATLSSLLGITMPPNCEGKILDIKKN